MSGNETNANLWQRESVAPYVLHLNISDGGGGVGRAAYRLHRGLLDRGVCSRMLVDVKTTDDPTVWGPSNILDRSYVRLRTRLDKVPGYFSNRKHWNYASFNYLPNPRIQAIWKQIKPQLLHLHWIGDGLLPLQYLKRIECPTIATMHGRWFFNGAQHLHSDQSKRFEEGFLPSNRDKEDSGMDVDRWVWTRKQKYLRGVDLQIVTLSRWMESDVRRSRLLKNVPVTRIPNGLNTDLFSPRNQSEVRHELGLQQDKKYILFGANYATQDQNKGFGDFVKAVQILEIKGYDFEIIVFGSDRPAMSLPYTSKTHFMGFITEEIALSKIYASSDCFVLPSWQDNLPNTVMESMASGTPCVAYDVGGVSDMIEGGINGFLAEPGNPDSLAGKIANILSGNSTEVFELRTAARSKIVKEFSIDSKTEDMVRLYESRLICKNSKNLLI